MAAIHGISAGWQADKGARRQGIRTSDVMSDLEHDLTCLALGPASASIAFSDNRHNNIVNLLHLFLSPTSPTPTPTPPPSAPAPAAARLLVLACSDKGTFLTIQ